MLYDNSLSEHLGIIHLQKTLIDFSPVRNPCCDRVKLRAMLMKGARLDLVNAHDRHEIEVRRG